jgi:hypothetical protein
LPLAKAQGTTPVADEDYVEGVGEDMPFEDGAFGELETYWPINSKVAAGDVVFIYVAAPYKQIRFVCDVLDVGLAETDILERIRLFFKGTPDAKKLSRLFMKLKPTEEFSLDKDALLGLPFLKQHALNGMLMGARKLENNFPLLTYIKGVME